MKANWLLVVLAAVFEVAWVIGLKHAYNSWTWLGTITAIFLSFFLMIRASKNLPVGTVYTVFVGLGTAGTVICEIVLFNKPFEWMKIMLVALLLIGVIGLKSVTSENDMNDRTSSGKGDM